MYDIIIIGAGPAGLTAGIYARRASKSVLIIEKLSYGGQIINTPNIENYPGESNIRGFDFATKLYNQAKDLGCEIEFEKVIEINNRKEVITDKNKYLANAIIIASGCNSRKLNLSNENELLGRGISYCATCDGNFYKNKNVAVVGGGNTALEDALYLSNIAKNVYLIHRRDEFRGDKKTLDLLKEKENVNFILNSNITKLLGNEKLEKIEINGNKELEIDGLFIAIGIIPNSDVFKDLINIDENGFIKSSENCNTNIPGIFVAGDIRVKEVRQLVTATSDGAIAAIESVKYINNMKKD